MSANEKKKIYSKLSQTRMDVEVDQGVPPLFFCLSPHLAQMSSCGWTCHSVSSGSVISPWTCSWSPDWASASVSSREIVRQIDLRCSPQPWASQCVESLEVYITQSFQMTPLFMEAQWWQHLHFLIPESCPGVRRVSFRNIDREPWCLSSVWVRRSYWAFPVISHEWFRRKNLKQRISERS